MYLIFRRSPTTATAPTVMMMTSLPPRNQSLKPSQNRFRSQLSNHRPRQAFFVYLFGDLYNICQFLPLLSFKNDLNPTWEGGGADLSMLAKMKIPTFLLKRKMTKKEINLVQSKSLDLFTFINMWTKKRVGQISPFRYDLKGFYRGRSRVKVIFRVAPDIRSF